MKSRAAYAPIKGYYYQFDTTILSLLNLQNKQGIVVVEGIEDIDIETATEKTSIQCKYLSKPRFINSAVREPIMFMLEHFIDPQTSNTYKYVLYVHFTEESPGNEVLIDLDRLKSILTYTEKKVQKCYYTEKGIPDKTLMAFLHQFRIVFGQEFHTQQKQVIQKLKDEFSCTDTEADTFFYNNALRVVIDRAKEKEENVRRISKKDFLEAIDCRKKIFNDWYIQLRSKEEYIKSEAKNLKTIKALDPGKSKIIIIGRNLIERIKSENHIAALTEDLIENYYKMNRVLRDAKPITVALDCEIFFLTSVKKALIKRKIVFNDGYEHLLFSPDVFNLPPVITTSKNTTRIINSSYLVKVISKESLLSNAPSVESPKIVIDFSSEESSNPFPDAEYIDIKYCDTISDIQQILIP